MAMKQKLGQTAQKPVQQQPAAPAQKAPKPLSL